MTSTRRGLDVLRARWQGWHVALAAVIEAEGHGLPVAAQQHRVSITRRGLDVLRTDAIPHPLAHGPGPQLPHALGMAARRRALEPELEPKWLRGAEG